MKNLILFICGLFAFNVINAQSVVPLRGDTIKIYKSGGSAELVLQNKTKDTLGFLKNMGNGRTEFHTLLSSGFLVNPMTDPNDMIIGGASGVPSRLSFPDHAGMKLGFDGTNIVWQDTSAVGLISSVFGRTGAIVAVGTDYSAFYPLLSGSYDNPSWLNSLPASKISAAGNVTAASSKITLGGTPSGAGLQNFSIDVNQANLSLSSIGGLLNVNQINATGTPSGSTVLYGDGSWGAAGGGGGGGTNLNVGTGYRWAIPGTNNIKTFFGRGYVVIDSSTNTNGITIYPDTGAFKLATKTDLLSYINKTSDTSSWHTYNFLNTIYFRLQDSVARGLRSTGWNDLRYLRIQDTTFYGIHGENYFNTKYAAIGSGFSNPMDAAGQLIYGGTSGTPTKTATPGHAGMKPVWNGTAVVWGDTTAGGGGFSDPLTTNNDIIARISGSTTRLPGGSNGTFMGITEAGTVGYRHPFGMINITDFQAVPDSSTDNTTAFQNAINSLMPTGGATIGGGTIMIPPGRWKITGKITIPDRTPIKFVGAGAFNNNTTAGLASDARYGPSTIFYTSTSDTAFMVRANGTSFNDLTIYCPSPTTTTTNVGIYVDSGNNFNMHRANVMNFNTNVFIRHGVFWSIDNSTLRNGHTYGIIVMGYDGADAGDSKIHHSYFLNDNAASASDTLLKYISGGGLVVEDCKFAGGGLPVYVPFLGSSDFNLIHNSIENFNGGTALKVKVSAGASFYNSHIVGNQMAGSGNSPIFIFDASAAGASIYNTIVDGNIFAGSSVDTAIYITGAISSTFYIGQNNQYYHVQVPVVSTAGTTVFVSGPNQAVTATEARRVDIDLSLGNDYLIPTLTGNDTVFFKGGGFGNRFVLRVQQGTGNYHLICGSGTSNPTQNNSANISINPVSGSVTYITGTANGVGGGAVLTNIQRGFMNGTVPIFYNGLRESSMLYDSANSKLIIPNIKIGASSTTGYVWTAVDAIGNGSWQASSGGFTNPLTTTGDIIYSSSGTTPARLGVGSTNQVLTVIGGVPSWQTPSSGFADPLTTNGDIIARIGGSTTRLPQGSNGQFLGVSGGAIGYYAPTTGPGGSTTQIQFNDGGVLSGASNALWDKTNNILTLQNNLGLNTDGDVLQIFSTGAATAGNSQHSPSLHFKGFGWSTTNSASRAVEFKMFDFPIQGAANPSGDLIIQSSVNGGGYNNVLDIGSDGHLGVNTTTQWNSAFLNVNGIADINGNLFINSSSSSTGIKFQNAGDEYLDMLASGEGLNVRTNALGLSAMHLDGGNGGAATFGSLTNQGRAQVEAVATARPQFSAVYDATHYTNFSTSSAGKLTIAPSAGSVAITGYGSGSNTGTATYGLSVDASGNLIEGVTVASADYTPTVTTSTNCAAATATVASYLRVGNKVHVNIRGSVTATASATDCAFTVTIPTGTNVNVASNEGSGTVSASPDVPASVSGSSGTVMIIHYLPSSTSATPYGISFDYSL